MLLFVHCVDNSLSCPFLCRAEVCFQPNQAEVPSWKVWNFEKIGHALTEITQFRRQDSKVSKNSANCADARQNAAGCDRAETKVRKWRFISEDVTRNRGDLTISTLHDKVVNSHGHFNTMPLKRSHLFSDQIHWLQRQIARRTHSQISNRSSRRPSNGGKLLKTILDEVEQNFCKYSLSCFAWGSSCFLRY